MIVKVYNVQGELMLAICDKDLLGTKIQTEEVEVEISDFYAGEEMSKEEILSLLKDATIVNAIGKNTVNFLISNGFVHKENVLYLGSIPHIQIIKMK